jgi:hypothetical protein
MDLDVSASWQGAVWPDRRSVQSPSGAEDQSQGGVDTAQLLEGQTSGGVAQALRIYRRGPLGQYPGRRPAMKTSGRKVAARAEVDVGPTSHANRGSRSDWTTTAYRSSGIRNGDGGCPRPLFRAGLDDLAEYGHSSDLDDVLAR